MIVTVTDATFDELVRRSPLPVLLEFTADWCPPCRMIAPALRELAAEYEGRLVVAVLDADANPGTVLAAGVMGMPTLIVYAGGEAVAQSVGARPKAVLKALIEDHLVPATL